jgi:hypothetical protein
MKRPYRLYVQSAFLGQVLKWGMGMTKLQLGLWNRKAEGLWRRNGKIHKSSLQARGFLLSLQVTVGTPHTYLPPINKENQLI